MTTPLTPGNQCWVEIETVIRASDTFTGYLGALPAVGSATPRYPDGTAFMDPSDPTQTIMMMRNGVWTVAQKTGQDEFIDLASGLVYTVNI